jgi:tRNA(Ile)-lysidine synthase
MTDSSNLEEKYLRNRIRLNLLPLLKKEYNPNIHGTLTRTAQLAMADEDFMDRAAQAAAGDIVREEEGRVIIDLDKLEGLHRALKRRVVRLAVDAAAAESLKGLSFGHVEEMLGLKTGRELHLPGGLRVQRDYGELVFFKHPPREGFEPLEVELSISGPGEYPVPGTEKMLTIELGEAPGEGQHSDENMAFLDPEKARFPLTLRSPRAGDRVALPGRGGTKKLSDLWTDAKLSRHKRRELLLLTFKDEIIWAPELYLNPRFCAGPGEKSLALRLG